MPLGEIVFDIGGGIPNGKALQGRADRRPFRRLHPAAAPQRPGRLRRRCRSSAPSWARAASSSWTRTPAWSTSPASSSSSRRTRAAASARPAASAPSACSRSSSASREGEGEEGDIERLDRPRRDHQARPRSAASARRRPTRCSRRSATSATSTRRTSATSTARPASARRCSRRAAATPARRASTSRASSRLVGEERYDEALQAAPRAQPAGQHLRPRLLPPLREQVPAREPRRRRWRSATSSASWSSRRRNRSCPRCVVDDENARRKVAIVGAGPAGLSAAYFLARLGYKPVVFEAETQGRAACSSRRSRPTGCRATSSSARSR